MPLNYISYMEVLYTRYGLKGICRKSYCQIMETRTYLKIELFILKLKRQDKRTITCTITWNTLSSTFFRYPLRRYKVELQSGSNQLHTIYLRITKKHKYQCLTDGLFTDFELETIIS